MLNLYFREQMILLPEADGVRGIPAISRSSYSTNGRR